MHGKFASLVHAKILSKQIVFECWLSGALLCVYLLNLWISTKWYCETYDCVHIMLPMLTVLSISLESFIASLLMFYGRKSKKLWPLYLCPDYS